MSNFNKGWNKDQVAHARVYEIEVGGSFTGNGECCFEFVELGYLGYEIHRGRSRCWEMRSLYKEWGSIRDSVRDKNSVRVNLHNHTLPTNPLSYERGLSCFIKNDIVYRERGYLLDYEVVKTFVFYGGNRVVVAVRLCGGHRPLETEYACTPDYQSVVMPW